MSHTPPNDPARSSPSGSTPPRTDPIADRRAKLHKLRDELKVNPFGEREDGVIPLAEAKSLHSDENDRLFAEQKIDQRADVKIAGRVVLHRSFGKLIFLTLRDESCEGLQIGVNKSAVDATSFQIAALADLGDLLVVRGRVGKSKTGEVTVWAITPAPTPAPGSESAVKMAAKSLAPPPGKFHGLTDAELRYRQRYVDFWANPEAARLIKLRVRIIEEVRNYLRGRGFLEVETPMLQPIHGGAAARPFKTHHNALDMPLYLRIAPELYLKRLLVGGFGKVFEINRNFRNEGISPRHNPEFTMLEAYEAFGSWETMADLVEDMVCTVAMKVFGTLVIEHSNEPRPSGSGPTNDTPDAHPLPHARGSSRRINLTRPWRRVSMVDLVAERTGWKFDKAPLTGTQIDALRAAHHGKDLKLAGGAAEQLVEVYEKLIEPTLIDPTFVTQVPSVCIPLARENRDDPFFADVYELAINGQEISPGYSELNDPDVQERHFRHQVGDPRNEEQHPIDEDFLNALRVGMPPAGGMGLGIDRLVMMLTGAESIRDVIAFPLLKPDSSGNA